MSMTEKDAFNDFYMASCWMDYIKDNGGMYWSGTFHYVDKAYIAEDGNYTIQPRPNATGALVLYFSVT